MTQCAHQRDRARVSPTETECSIMPPGFSGCGKNRNVHPSVFDRPEPYVRHPEPYPDQRLNKVEKGGVKHSSIVNS